MATRTNPLVSAVVLASAAAVAVATPAIAPSVQLPSPHALQAAKVQLATFSDLLSISATDWSNVLFGGYGEAISPNQDPSFDWAAAYVSPFTGCDFNCKVNGPSGVAYLALDSLINGNGTGYAPVLKDPTKPYNETTNPYVGGYPTWSVGAVNYFFEGGTGPGVEYLVVQPFGDPKSPLYNPTVAGILTQAFQGAANVTTFYVAGLTALANLAVQVPAVGPYIYGAINAYLGPNTSDPYFGNWGYYAGLSGVLRYVSDVITTGGNPYPPYGPTQSAASTATLAAAATLPAAAASVAEAPKVEAAPASRTAKETASVDTKVESTPAVSEVKVSAPVDTKVASTPAVSEVKVSAPVVSEPKVSTPAVSAPASTPAPEVKPVEAPSAPEVKPSTPAVDSAPAKDLGKEIAKSETSTSSTASSSSTGAGSDSKSGASDSKPATSDVKVSTPEATSSATTTGASETKASSTETKSGGSDAGSSSASGDSAK